MSKPYTPTIEDLIDGWACGHMMADDRIDDHRESAIRALAQHDVEVVANERAKTVALLRQTSKDYRDMFGAAADAEGNRRLSALGHQASMLAHHIESGDHWKDGA